MKRYRSPQRGFILVLTLVILVAMTLLGITLVRSVDTSTLIATNLGFRQSALMSGDRGTEAAVLWLQNNTASLTSDASASGYYATEQSGTDFTGKTTPTNTADDVDWAGAAGSTRRAFVVAGTDVAGNQIAYIIHRMCDQAGSYAAGGTIQCATFSATSATTTGGSQGSSSYGSYAITGKTMIYYRITTRTQGVRNTESFVQTQVLLEY
jgi:type IV pilus assembly protein PilX